MKLDLLRIFRLAAGIPGSKEVPAVAAKIATAIEKALGIKMFPVMGYEDTVRWHSSRGLQTKGGGDLEITASLEVEYFMLGDSRWNAEAQFPLTLVRQSGAISRRHTSEPSPSSFAHRVDLENDPSYRKVLWDSSVRLGELHPQSVLAFLPHYYIKINLMVWFPQYGWESRESDEVAAYRIPETKEIATQRWDTLIKDIKKELNQFAIEPNLIVWIDSDETKAESPSEKSSRWQTREELLRGQLKAGILMTNIQHESGPSMAEEEENIHHQEHEWEKNLPQYKIEEEKQEPSNES